MIQFKYERYVRNYEIDYYNGLTQKEKEKLSKNLGITIEDISHNFYKTYNGWSYRISGMTFDIKDLYWYPIMKKHLDKEFNIFMRKEKLKKLNSI